MSHRHAILSLYYSFSIGFRVSDLLAFRAEAFGLESEFGVQGNRSASFAFHMPPCTISPEPLAPPRRLKAPKTAEP